MQEVCLLYSRNNKIVWLSNMADTFLRNSRGAQRFVGFFFLIVLFGFWLAEQASSGHMANTQFINQLLKHLGGQHPRYVYRRKCTLDWEEKDRGFSRVLLSLFASLYLKKNENANLRRYVGSGYPVSRARDTWSIRAATQILAGKLIFAEGGKPESLEKSPRSQIEINQSQPTYEPWIESRSQWWEARMMTSEDGLKPKSNHNPNPNLTLKKEAKERNLEKGKKPVRV